VIIHMNPSISTMRNTMSDFTDLWKTVYVKRGETNKNGLHIDIVRNTLTAPQGQVIQYINDKAKKQIEKLGDKYVEKWEDLHRISRTLYDKAMNEDAGPSRSDMMGLLISIMLSIGCRKGAILDSHVEFLDIDQYEKKNPGFDFRIGSKQGEDDDDMGQVILLDGETYPDDKRKYLIAQVGVLKDSSTQINRYIDKDDERFVSPRTVIKPSIILTGREVFRGVKAFRKFFKLTKANFDNRVSLGNRFSTRDFQPLMKLHFPRAYAKSQANGWDFSTHYARKCYANASFGIYENQVRALTGKYVDRNRWIMLVLAHGGSVSTSLGYSVVLVDFSLSTTLLNLPPEHRIRLLQGEVDSLRHMMNEIRTQLNLGR
jgi:hypothetical protein